LFQQIAKVRATIYANEHKTKGGGVGDDLEPGSKDASTYRKKKERQFN
jgi:hypothetical protein